MAERRKTEPVSSIDTAWLRMDHSTNLMMITTVMTFDEPIDFERLKATVEHRMLKFNRFRQRVLNPDGVGGPPQWEDDPYFDLRSHLRRVALPAPGDQYILEELVSDLMSTPLDPTKPLWQMHLVENYGSGCALVARIHHCIADGIALVHVMLSMTDSDPHAPWPSADEARRKWRNPFEVLLRPAASIVNTTVRTTTSLWSQSYGLMADPVKVLEAMQMSANSISTMGHLLSMPADPPTVFKGRLGVAKRAVWSTPIPLEQVKAVGRFTHSTINDILLTAMTGALRRYLIERGEKVDGLDIRAVVPVNLRPLDKTPKLGNQFGLIFLALPVGIADPLDRLLVLQERMETIKSSPEALVAFGVLTAMGTVPRQIEEQMLTFFGSKGTGVMTNVPGPREPVYMAGRRASSIMFWVPQSGRLGLGVSIMSYNGEVRLGVATDVGLVPDPDRIIAAFQEEFAYYAEMVRRAEAVQTRYDQAIEAAKEAEAEPSDAEEAAPEPEPQAVAEVRAEG